ncbi:MAG: MBL fold metallo-hydrolase [Acidobacteriota bacterium]
MQDTIIHDLDFGLHLIEDYDMGVSGRTGTYVFKDAQELTLLETGPSPSVPHILKGLAALGLDPADVKWIIVTHIHLDHAGGAGLLLKDCPQAKVVVHPRGARHLADPSRLVAGARAVYGDRFDGFFNPVVPIPEDRLLVCGEGDTLKIAPGRTLRFLDTPGHARHHFTIHDPMSNGLFTGDAAGVFYRAKANPDHMFFMPVTSPNQFDPDAMLAVMDRFKSMKPGRLFFGHYSECTEVERALDEVAAWLPRFVSEGKSALEHGEDWRELSARMAGMVQESLAERGLESGLDDYPVLRLDLDIAAMGVLDMLSKRPHH